MIEIVIAENFAAWTVEIEKQARGPIHSSLIAAQRAAKQMSEAFEREGQSGSVYSQKGAGPIRTLLWEFGRASDRAQA